MDEKISQLTQISNIDPTNLIPIVDTIAAQTKSITIEQLDERIITYALVLG